ncbi:hypothetical protein C8F04DRAFT_1105986 [Mycena alexandri]|uniref:Uncharacterized protein n=1 Tax=Mycena alexandri TaxID=1745969 RepID=A0AAD6SRQ9_9AGAR|nr:hypothetical protein C8F04DRAFT_1404206 [Mycena alexandri]KAJ7032851.1 hypothetical protein C8F04DRAFT_1105986 [Mycena alexandri]
MSGTGSFNVGSSTLYRYPIIAALAIVIVIGGMLCWRSRVIERRARLLMPLQAPEIVVAKTKPNLYDVYLGSRGELWHEIMPLSHSRVGSGPQNLSKDTSLDVDPEVSALSTVALMIAMPSNSPRAIPVSEFSPDRPDLEQGLPYLEFGLADVEVLKCASVSAR